jgi:hypothetical protein
VCNISVGTMRVEREKNGRQKGKIVFKQGGEGDPKE